jgi:hypothetical protein
VAGGEEAVTHVTLNARRQLEEAEGVCDGRPAFADPAGYLVMGKTEVLDQLLIGGRFIERVQVLALQVLDERLFQAGDVLDLTDEGGDRRETGTASCSVAAFSGDDLVLAGSDLPHENRLENADDLDRVDE